MEKEDNVLFKIKDHDYLINQMSILITCYILILIMLGFGASFEDRGIYTLRTVVVIGVGGTIVFFTTTLYSYTKRGILFYENKIVLKKFFNSLEIKTIDLEEVYKVFSFNINSNKNRKLIRWDIPRKIVVFLMFPVFIPLLCIYTVATYISNFIIFKFFLWERYKIILIGKNKKDFLTFNFTGDNQLKVEDYFLKKLNINVKRMETTRWFFIPNIK